MRGFGLVLLPLVAKLATAQEQYTIDPDSVPQSLRDTWCSNQQSACPLICLQTAANSSETVVNDCDPDTLQYSCVCDDNITPNASEYSQTLPYYICTEWGNQCVSKCSGNTDCEYNCRANHPCGAQSPKRVNVTSSTASATASKTASGSAGGQATNSAGQTVYNGLGGDSAASSTASSSSQTGAAAALQLGQAYGLFAVAAGIFGGFAILL